jgi:hypothetical protein
MSSIMTVEGASASKTCFASSAKSALWMFAIPKAINQWIKKIRSAEGFAKTRWGRRWLVLCWGVFGLNMQ